MALLDAIFGIRTLLVRSVEATSYVLDVVGAAYSRDLALGTTTLYPGALPFTAVQAAPYTAALGEHVRVSGAHLVTLPSAATGPGQVTVTNVGAAGTPTVDGAGSDTINGSGSAVSLTGQWTSRTFQSDGAAAWVIVGGIG